MAPKPPIDPSSDPLVILFKSIGLPQSKAVEANKNPKSANVLKDLIEKYSLVAAGLNEKQAVLVTAFAGNVSKAAAVGDDEKGFVVANILDRKLQSVDQVSGEYSMTRWRLISDIRILAIVAATKYIESHKVPIDQSDFDKQCGVGMSPLAIQRNDLSPKYHAVQDFLSLQKNCSPKLAIISRPTP
jgi:glutaminyl-tRNA synthetase